jgi:pseudaminic acid cytidylyltransferase
MTTVAIIPARGGSKRIPRKNVRQLAGKPVITYPIELALESGLFERVIVSTEDQEIAATAISFGAEVPFLRSAELSDDFATTIDVISDAAQRLELQDSDSLCCIYPVTPLLSVERLLEANTLLMSGNWDYVFPATEYTMPIERAFRKDPSGKPKFLAPEYVSIRTQDIQKSFYDSGQFYFGRAEAWKRKLPILSGNSTFIELLRHEVIDIDEEADWEFAVQIMELKRWIAFNKGFHASDTGPEI